MEVVINYSLFRKETSKLFLMFFLFSHTKRIMPAVIAEIKNYIRAYE